MRNYLPYAFATAKISVSRTFTKIYIHNLISGESVYYNQILPNSYAKKPSAILTFTVHFRSRSGCHARRGVFIFAIGSDAANGPG